MRAKSGFCRIAAFVTTVCMVMGGLAAQPGSSYVFADTTTSTDQATATSWIFSEGFSSTQGNGGWSYLERTGGANSSSFTAMTYSTDSAAWKGTNGSQIQSGRLIPGGSGDAVLAWDCPKDGYYQIAGWAVGESNAGDGILAKVVKGNASGISNWSTGQIWPELQRGSGSWYNNTGYTILRSDMDRDNFPGQYQNTVLSLSSGDRIYFIANRNADTDSDTLLWDPRIEEVDQLPFELDNKGLVVNQGYVDGSLAMVSRGDGTYNAYNSLGYAFSHNTNVRFRITSLNPLTYTKIADLPAVSNCDGYPDPWLNYIENTHKINDNGTPDDPTDDPVIAFMHLENYASLKSGWDVNKVTYKLGLALSRDGGETFTQVGDILGNAVDQNIIQNNSIAGGFNIQGVPFFVAPDGYLYIYYSESMPVDTNVRKYGCTTLSVARAQYEDVVRALLYNDKANLATLFKKYYNSVWSEPGIDTAKNYTQLKVSGGYGASVEDSDRGAHTMICYNDYAQKSVQVNPSNNGFSIKFSRDPNNWFVPSYIFDKGEFYFYGTLADEHSEDPNLLGQSFNVFYGCLSGTQGYKQSVFTLTDNSKKADDDALIDYLRLSAQITQGNAPKDTWDDFQQARVQAADILGNAEADQSSLNHALDNLGSTFKNLRIPSGTEFASVTNPEERSVALGTPFSVLQMPDKIGVVKATAGSGSGSLALGNVMSTMVNVTWDSSTYQGDTAGTYTVSGTLSGPSNLNLNGLTARATIVVGAEKWTDNGGPDVPNPGPDPYHDDFTDNTAGGWSLISGDPATITMNAADQQLQLAANSLRFVAVDQSAPDYQDGILEMTLTPKITASSGWGTSNLGNFGILARATSDSSYVALEYDYGTTWYIENGTGLAATIKDGPRLNDGQSYRLKIRFEGARIQAWVDDTQIYDGSLSSIPTGAGKIGARGWGFGNIKITSASLNPLSSESVTADYPGVKHSATVSVMTNQSTAQTGTVTAADFGIDSGLRGLAVKEIAPVGDSASILSGIPAINGSGFDYETTANLTTTGQKEDYRVTFSCDKYQDFSVIVRFETKEGEQNVDLTPLEDALKAAGKVPHDAAYYTVSSWNALQSAIEQGNQVVASANPSASAVSEATAAIQSAISQLKQRGNTTVLSSVIDAYKDLDLNRFTPESTQNFSQALAQAQALLAEDVAANTSMEDMTAAARALVAAAEALVYLPDKSSLAESITYAQQLLANESTYIPEGVAALKTVLASAQAVMADAQATQQQIDDALNSMVTAISGMLPAGNKDALQMLFTIYSVVQENSYTPDSWAVFSAALANADLILKDENAVQEQIDPAYDALLSSFGSLIRMADRSALNAAITVAQNILNNSDQYIPSSITGLQAVLTQSTAALQDPNASQDQVNAARQALNSETLKARMRPDTSALSSTIRFAKKLKRANYSRQSYETVTNALNAGNDALKNPETTQDEADQLLKTLMSALSALKAVSQNQQTAVNPPEAPIPPRSITNLITRTVTSAPTTSAVPETGSAQETPAASENGASTVLNDQAVPKASNPDSQEKKEASSPKNSTVASASTTNHPIKDGSGILSTAVAALAAVAGSALLILFIMLYMKIRRKIR